MAPEDHLDLPDDLDTLLRDTMSVRPSPAFLPRVRARIETERPASISGWRMLALIGAAAAVFLVAGSLGDVGRIAGPPEPTAPRVAQAIPSAPPANRPDLPPPHDVPKAVRTAASRAHAPVRSPRVEDMPRVIVDRQQRTAVRQMMTMIAQGRLTEEAFAHTIPSSIQPIEDRLVGIAVLPLEVSPIGTGGVLQLSAEPKQPPRPADAGISRP